MSAVMKRELNYYFSSAIGYIFIAVFYVFAGFYFFATCLLSGYSTLSYVFSNMFAIAVFLVPVLTMRLWSEEKKQKTDQALFTAPVKLLPIVLGKYFAALIIYAISLAIFLVFGLVISCFVTPEWSVIIGNLIGLFLLGAALIAIGMFLSSLTENQVIAAVSGFAVGLVIMMLDSIGSLFSNTFLVSIFTNLSFNAHYTNFTTGLLNFVDVIFFLSVISVFVFLTVRVFEKKRWS